VTQTLFPRDPLQRALTYTTMAASLATGLFFTVSALYFTRVIGLSATTVGLGLTVAGGAGVVAAYAGGRLADRFGADRVQLWTTVVQGLALLAYVWAADLVAFVMVACVAVGARAMQSTAKNTVVARWFTGIERVTVRARQRVVTNVFIGLGTLLAAVALLIGSATAYQVTMAAVAVLTLAAVLPLVGLRDRIEGLGAAMRRPVVTETSGTVIGAAPGRSPLRDRTYLAATALNAVMAMQFGMQTVGVPLWIANATEAPTVMVSVLLVVNTAGVALLQVRAARGTDDLRVAGRTVRRAGALLLAACLLLAAAGEVGAYAAVALLLVGEIALTWAEVAAEAGGWGLAFELADPDNVGAYQGVQQTGYAIAAMAAPTVVTALAIEHGPSGWLALGCIFLVAGCLVPVVADRAAARRAEAVGLEMAA